MRRRCVVVRTGCCGGDDTGFVGRRLQLTQSPDGSWRINGVLDPLAGEAVEAALVAATPNPSPQDSRSPAQRRADGFTDLCRWFLAQDDRGEVGGERPNVNVVFHLVDGSAHTSNGYFLRNWQLSQVMCDATLTAVAASLKGTVLDVGTPLSVIPVRNRRAVVVRDWCCRMGGCSGSPRWCQIHHIRERENGGTHELDNLVLLCTYHHREVHRKGIVLHWEDVILVATMPGGATLHGPPHPDTIPVLFYLPTSPEPGARNPPRTGTGASPWQL